MKSILILSLGLLLSTLHSEASLRSSDAELEAILNESNSTYTDAVSSSISDDLDTPEPNAPLHYKKLMGQISSWKKPSAKFPNRNTTDYCWSQVQSYQCEHSEFKDLGFKDRYHKVKESIDRRAVDSDTSHAATCIMSRETGIFEPITVSYANCMPGLFATDLGLGQVTLGTFLHILGLSNKEITKMVSHYLGRPGYVKKKWILSDERANALANVTDVAPFNTLEYRKNPMRMFEEMADSYEFQIDMTLNVLKAKKAISENTPYLDQLKLKLENPKLTPKQKLAAEKKLKGAIAWYQQKTYENYNGSKTKVRYGAAVFECKSCLDAGKKDIVYCLGLAMGTKDLEDFTVCKK